MSKFASLLSAAVGMTMANHSIVNYINQGKLRQPTKNCNRSKTLKNRAIEKANKRRGRGK